MAALRILDVAIEMVADVMVLVRRVGEGRIGTLSRQLKRAAMSVAAQIGEGTMSPEGEQGALACRLLWPRRGR